ncbi:hypothetical protein Vafri_6771 [Volvox africanus]|uniref:Integrase catalytic domain-containing protein n=1 Tax=Volvox africanus TaxID=51714 RepID=A0A8J4AZF6_9CHLO|nr:hypothetical protein Vafri_6771 [Volvox africanus]
MADTLSCFPVNQPDANIPTLPAPMATLTTPPPSPTSAVPLWPTTSPPIDHPASNALRHTCLTLASHTSPDPTLLDTIRSGYTTDPMFSNPTSLKPYLRQSPDGLFYLANRIAIPNVPSLRRRLLYEFHDYSGHPGSHRTLAAISARYWWPHMSHTVQAYVKFCATCQRTKPSTQTPPGLLQLLPTPNRPWTHVSIDFITDLPPSKGLDGRTYTAIFTIILDRDPRFIADVWQTLWTHLGTSLNISSAYHPQTDGQTERTHHTIEQILRAYVKPMQDNWAAYLPITEAAYNNSPHASTGTTFFAISGYHLLTPATLHGPQADPAEAHPAASNLHNHLHDIHSTIFQEN